MLYTGVNQKAADEKEPQVILNYENLGLEETHKLIEALLGFIFVLGADGKIFSITPKYQRRFGYSDDEINKEVSAMDLLDSKEMGRRTIEETIQNGYGEFEADIVTKDGAKIPHVLRSVAVNIAGQQCIVGTAFDISDRVEALKKVQEQHNEMVHISRVAAMGELASAFAHEINQPLAAIANNARAAERLFQSGNLNEELMSQILGDISSDARRAGDITKNLRSLLKKEDDIFTTVDLNASIQKIVEILRSSVYKTDPVIITEFCSSTPLVKGVEIQIQQVAMNLVTNAADAIRSCDDRPHEVIVSTSCSDDGHAVFSVFDNGQHLSDDIIERVFDPFFTTKSQGLGMGLSISRSIIEKHHGSISVENCSTGGVRFAVRIPLTDELAQE
ncbi:PAS domain S-box protein [Pseudomaricurvus alkylphenolicus]|uniref:PAS domain-containing sensor histidine kinase n=1 Tax=Pseudomaricurvus alkylphenolicus TaxID=1306991 RepID=UPI0014213B05|nr:ATP-binding protein [Pseudomaricurvus alkylphenolicus]NIB38719.1 PAS domain S-box protein [Pseudomaricurvus alkylphenolicus]